MITSKVSVALFAVNLNHVASLIVPRRIENLVESARRLACLGTTTWWRLKALSGTSHTLHRDSLDACHSQSVPRSLLALQA
jgi:hypothetical protein